MTEDGQAVWTHLIEHFLQRVGKEGGDYYSHQYMIACTSHRYVPGPCVEPPADSQRAKHVFVGTHVMVCAICSAGRPVCAAILFAIATSASVGFTRKSAMLALFCTAGCRN